MALLVRQLARTHCLAGFGGHSLRKLVRHKWVVSSQQMRVNLCRRQRCRRRRHTHTARTDTQTRCVRAAAGTVKPHNATRRTNTRQFDAPKIFSFCSRLWLSPTRQTRHVIFENNVLAAQTRITSNYVALFPLIIILLSTIYLLI